VIRLERRDPDSATSITKETSTMTAYRRRFFAYLTAAIAALAIVGSLPAAADAAPTGSWAVTMISSPTNFDQANKVAANSYVITARNLGGATIAGPVTLTDTFPAGMTVNTDPQIFFTALRAYPDNEGEYATCEEKSPGVVCEFAGITVPPGQAINMVVPVSVPPSLNNTTVHNEVTITGGGIPDKTAETDTKVTSELASPGFDQNGSESWLTNEEGEPETQAGAHPETFHFNFQLNTFDQEKQFTVVPSLSPKRVVTKLPHGFVINPRATPVRCTEVQLEHQNCPDASAVGSAHSYVGLIEFANYGDSEPVFNMYPQPGEAASLAFEPYDLGIFVHLHGGVDTEGDYTLTAEGDNIPQYGSITGIGIDLWGDPSAPSHNSRRGECGFPAGASHSCPVPPDETPFITMPSACSGPLSSTIIAESWNSQPPISTELLTTDTSGNPVGVAGCSALEFEPTIKARPTTNVADAPTGLEVNLHMPHEEKVGTLAAANLKDATVSLPPGLVVNPASGNGLGACSASQIGLTSGVGGLPIRTTAAAATCPDSSKLGSVEITTPLLDHPLPGAVYLAKPYENPFGSLLALYIAVDDPITGVVLKLAGKVTPDPQTGQLTATFSENPELPVEDFGLKFFGGATAPLRTPAVCGSYTTNSTLTPWSAPDSGPPRTPTDTWAIEQGANGGGCVSSEAALPNNPSLDAGTVSPIAGTYSPLVVNLRREDGTQQFGSVKLSPPPGLLAKLAGIPYCSESDLATAAAKSGAAETANPSCPAASRIGSVSVGVGSGPAPYYAPGNVYLTGPYKGAPLSLAIVTPATAGPFDLGTVVVRTAVFINPITTQITAVSDQLPSILKGIPLDIRSAQIKLDRSKFSLNPTSCDPSTFGGDSVSLLSQTSALSSRFQVGECGRLSFKPKLTLSLKGGTTRNSHPALTATLEPGSGANLGSVSVALPHSEFLEQSHIRTVCTRVQFAANQCPAASIYGEATVTTPLLDYPLTGPVYLRSSNNKLPDLVPALRGPANQPIELQTDARIDTFKGGIRNTFEFVPDAPFTKFVLKMQGGRKGLLVNSTNICAGAKNLATVKYVAQNGAALATHPALHTQCPKSKPAKKHGKKKTKGQH
jgi:hypothetical protein